MNQSSASFHYPDNGITWNLWRKLSREFRLAFIFACIVGGITHLYMFSNLLLSSDGTSYITFDEYLLSSGRWAVSYASYLSGIYQLPVVIGLISVLMLALTAGLTVRVLEISHPFNIFLTSALLVTFLPVACTFAFMFTADAYFIALFLNAVAVCITKKYRFGWLFAIVLICVACGIYQAYICYAIGLFLLDCILALFSQEELRSILIRGGRYVLTLVLGLLCYFAVTKVLLHFSTESLVSYMGMDTIGGLHLGERLAAIPKAYHTFSSYFLEWPCFFSFLRLFHFGVLLVMAGSLLYLFIARELYRFPLRSLLIVLGVLMIPLSLSFISVLNYTNSTYWLMIYAYVLLFVFAVKCAELAGQSLLSVYGDTLHWKTVHIVCAVCCLAIIWNNFCVTNIGYHSLQVCYENSFALATSIFTQIQMLDGYSPDTPITYIGTSSRESLHGNYKLYEMGSFELCRTINTNLVVKMNFFRNYIGMQNPRASAEQRRALENSETVAAMPNCPMQGSIAMVDGVIVVKLNNGTAR